MEFKFERKKLSFTAITTVFIVLVFLGLFVVFGKSKHMVHSQNFENVSVSGKFKNCVNDDTVERFKNNFNVYLDIKNLDVDAEIMFEKVKNFLEEAKDISDENFVEYERSYIANHSSKSDQNKLRVENLDWFTHNESNGDYLMVYGSFSKEQAAGLRQGKVDIGCYDSGCNMLDFDHGIFVSPFYENSNFYSAAGSEHSNSEIVRFALNKNIKLIHVNYLTRIFSRMIEKHADYFKNYLDLTKLYGDYGDFGYGSCGFLTFNPWRYSFRYVADFVKINAGYDYYGSVGTECAENCLNKLKEKLATLIGLKVVKNGNVVGFLDDITVEQKTKREEFNKFLYDKEAKNKEYYIDKVYAISKNIGLLARLMGYGGFANCFLDGENKPTQLASAILLVDVDSLVVCSD